MEKKQMNKTINMKELNSKNTVSKSRLLLLALDNPYSIGQIKLIDTYISCINPLDKERTLVRFPLKEYEHLIGIKRMEIKSLQNNLSGLLKTQITIPLKSAEGDFIVCRLFDKAICYKEPMTNSWFIELNCDESAKRLFFNIEKFGYIRYNLENTMAMKSKYSISLYQYLKADCFRINWKVEIDRLRGSILHCDAQNYKNHFSDFNEKVLKPSVNEINKKSDLMVEYSTIFSSGRVIEIGFYATSRPCSNINKYKTLSNDNRRKSR